MHMYAPGERDIIITEVTGTLKAFWLLDLDF